MNIDLVEPNNRIRIPPTLYHSNNTSHKISALLETEKNLFVGLNNGDLLIYTISKVPIKESDKPQSSSRSFRSLKSFTDIKVLFHENNQYTLSNNFRNITKNNTGVNGIKLLPLSLTKLIVMTLTTDSLKVFEIVGNHINLIHSIDDSKITDYLYLHDNEDRKLLILSSRKRLWTYQITNKSRNLYHFDKIKEIVVKEKIRTIIEYNKDSIIISLINDYFLVNIHTFNISPIGINENLNTTSSFSYFNLSSSGPQTWTIPIDSDNILLVKDTTILNLSKETQELRTLSIKLGSVPVDIKFIYPIYLFVVYPKKFEIIDLEDGDLLQKFNHQINFSTIPINLHDDIISLASGTYVLQFKIKSYESQIDQYLKISGKTSAKSIKSPMNDLRYLGIEKAILLLSRLGVSNSLFVNEKDKLMKLRNLYTMKATLLFESYSKYHESLVDISSEWLLSFRDVLNLFPDFLNGEVRVFPKETEEVNGVHSSNIIKKITTQDLQTNAFIESEYDTDTNTPKTQSINKSQNIRKFYKAVNNLIIYLTEQRRILSTFMNKSVIQWKDVEIKPREIYPSSLNQLNDVATVIDTSLFLCYFHCKPMLLGPLLRLPNNYCDSNIVNECLLSNIHNHTQQRKLKQPNFIKELLDFYYTRNLHKDALEMLFKLSFDSSEVHSNEEDNQIDDYLKGPQLTIKYLNKLTNEYLLLIFEYCQWVIQLSESNARLIFMNDSYECESYDSDKILQFFINKNYLSLAIEYLEWLLFQNETKDDINYSKFETKLALLYLHKLKTGKFDQIIYDKLYNLLKLNQSFDPWPILKELPTTDDRYLRLTTFAYKKLEEHEKSIDVLYNQLNDLNSAMKYCEEIYDRPNGTKLGSNLFYKLLEDILMSDDYSESIVKFLNLHGVKIPISKILNALPKSFQLNHLNQFLNSKYQKNIKIMHDKQIKNQLYKTGNTNLERKVMVLQNESYRIDSSKQLCTICRKKLGYGIFTVTDDGNVIHYKCSSKSDGKSL